MKADEYVPSQVTHSVSQVDISLLCRATSLVRLSDDCHGAGCWEHEKYSLLASQDLILFLKVRSLPSVRLTISESLKISSARNEDWEGSVRHLAPLITQTDGAGGCEDSNPRLNVPLANPIQSKHDALEKRSPSNCWPWVR